ncbi:hypothetical protein JJJ17_11205 [Paracoccus caeni]|uniref:Uncharacterized protein n=1 Tax=Paracoccus caeni TaxID=657651 RepID=A0A934W166_9RHOB|nr:hypothetical protein [Paracoccus caeni]MBK4216494.1 hypothetical protein [Paracoccus caeni]
MADTEIDNMVTEITFEPLIITATPPTEATDDLSRLREILRPLILDLLAEEYDTVRRIMGG